MSEAMDLSEALAMARRVRLAEEAPAMLAALRKAQELLRDLESPAHLYEGAALDDEMTAILARIDGTPTDEPAETCETCGFVPQPTPTDDSCDCPTDEPASDLERYTVRIDACFSYEIEAGDEDSAIEQAEAQFAKDQTGGRITETLVFEGES